MKGTHFKSRRLPKIGDIIRDKLSDIDVLVVEIRDRNIMVDSFVSMGAHDVYSRNSKYFDWKG